MHTKVDYPSDKTIHQLFEEQVKRSPSNTAVVYEAKELTYQQLNERANQLAHYLRAQGVGPDTLVAIGVERSLEMIIGLLAILKAGGAYVPLDPSYPEDRLQFMLEDTNAPVLITQAHLKERFKDYPGKVLSLQLDAETKELLIEESSLNNEEPEAQVWMNLSTQSSKNPLPLSTPHNLAYVIYTSGSTGKPKGTQVNCMGVVNCIYSLKKLANVNKNHTFLALTSISFDVAAMDYYLPFSVGARVIIASQNDQKDALALNDIIKKQSVNCIQGTPSLFQMLSSAPNYDLTQKLKLLLAGEALPKELANKLKNNNEVFNVYGPTEGTIYSSFTNIENEKIISIGRPIDNTQIYILDESLNPVPVGVSGELYIGGVGLARGYLNRPDLTAERFVPNPFVQEGTQENPDSSASASLSSNSESLRLYRTGDLARYLIDGNIEFLGRIDDQVKIRGFRIELGEIESTLVSHEDVSQVVVMAREDEPGNKKLVAYVIPEDRKASSLLPQETFSSSSGDSFTLLTGESLPAFTETLRNHLALSLPDYMVPSFFVYLDKVPLTSNGKVDRKSLPAPDLSLRSIGDEYVAPQSTLELALSSIWSEVLKVEKIGIHDNFLRIGGDSILSLLLVAKARHRGIYFNVKDIFTYPTIAGLSSIARIQEDSLTLKPDQNIVEGEVALTPIQSWFFDRELQNKNHYNQATLLTARSRLNLDFLTQALELLISHHDALRFKYSKQNSQTWKQEGLKELSSLSNSDSSLLTVIDLSQTPDTDLPFDIERESSFIQQSLDIENGPVMRVVLFECGQSRSQRLLIVIHHLVVDGVSWRILLEDLERIYGQFAKGETPTLLPKTHSYQQWAKALNEYAPSEELAKELPYWKSLEEHINPLPTDFNKGPASNFATFVASLSAKETSDLLYQVPKAYRTQINDLLLTALVLAIGDWKGSYDLSLSLEGHGREDIIKDIDLSRTVGWFTSLFPVHLNIENPNDLSSAIKTVKEGLRHIPHKGIGYGILAYLKPNSPLNPHIHSTLSFNYLGQWDNTLASEGLFSFSQESIGNNVSELNTNPHLLDINAEVKEGVLHIAWGYSQNYYHKKTLETLSANLVHRLKQLIHHCCQDHNFGYTPSDFPLARFTQENLNVSFRNIPHVEQIYPLSSMQSGLLFYSLYTPGSDAYFVQTLFNFEAKLDIGAFKSAWQKVCNTHSIFKTGIFWETLETPLQYVLETVEIPFEVIDWQGLKEGEQKEKLDAFIQEDRKRGFDLSKPPLFRLTLIQWGPERYSLVWSQHHILLDGWCLPIVLGDVLKAYEAILQGKEVRLPFRRPFKDYIAWLQHQDIEQAEKFWGDALQDLEGPTNLSFKGLVDKNPGKDYDTYLTSLSESDTENLRKFAQDHNLTLNTLIQGAVGAVLKTYTRQEEIVLGVTVSGRSIDLPGIEDMVGLFINTLPLRMSFNPKEPLLPFLHTLQKTTQKLNEYAYVSLAQVQTWSGLNQSLFDVLFIFENYPLDESTETSSSGFRIKDIKGIEKTEYPLTIAVGPGKQLHLSLSYQTEHFNEEIIKNLSEHIKQVLQGMVHSSKEESLQPIYELPLLTPEEKHQLLIEWNDTKADYPSDKTIHQLFEEQVKRSPSNTAVVYEAKELTYQQLNERANQLAHYLRAQGVGPDTLVAIGVERSLEMIIGLLAILKAGGAYVPLDPSYPEDRLQFMLEDTNAPVLITQAHLKERFKDYPGKVLSLQLDAETKELLIEESSLNNEEPEAQVWMNLSTQSSKNLHSLTSPHNLAYVIYTSGSTGKPKGVMINYQNLSHYLNYSKNTYPGCQGVTLLHSSIAFDMSITSLFLPLTSGGKVDILPEQTAADSLELILKKASDFNFIKFTPSHLKALKNRLTSQYSYNQKRCLVVGGENLLREDIEMWLDNTSSTLSVFNEYGPTESTVGCCVLNLHESYDISLASVPIGRPIDNTQIYILDESLNPVPIGVSGELYIGGVGLARGYLNRPDLTAERFVPNPFVQEGTQENPDSSASASLSSNSESLRLYRTGDLARYLIDGNIEFLGRIDDQVKIRGFRIELGEIESTLVSHEDVSQVVVMAREDEPGNKKLVAYVIPEDRKASSLLPQETFSSSSGDSFTLLTGESLPAFTETLRNHLALSLPDYMVPSFFVYLDKVPLTSNGKVDRKSLPAPDLSLRSIGDEYVAPQSTLELALSSIWSEVLKVEKIGIHDNFFKIGGDSIISIQLVAKARQRGIYFNVKDVFNYLTIADLASVAKTQEDNPILKPDQNTIEGEVALTPIQSWFFDRNLQNKNHYNQAILLEALSPLKPDFLNQALELLISHHDALRFKYSKQNSQTWKQEGLKELSSLSNSDSSLLTVIDLSQTPDTDLPFDIERESSFIQQSLDIENGPVMRVVLFECGQSRSQRLLIVIHHLVVDGVSWRILLEDLERIYGQFAKGETATLLPKTHSYQQWAKALNEYAPSEELAKELPYWKSLEEHINPLPTDFNKGPACGSAVSTIAVSLTVQETTDLLQKVPEAYQTQINDILLTALLLAIGDWKGSYDLSLSLEGHGREDIIKDIDLSRTVGWFTSLFPVHLNIENPNDLSSAIKTVKEGLRHIPHKGIGYGILAYLKPNSPLNPHIHSTLSFNYLGQWDNTLASEGLFSFSQEPTGKTVSDLNASSHLLDINAEVKEGALHAVWTYSQNHYHKKTLETLSRNFINRLKQLIHHCCQNHNFGYTSSDFDLVTIDQATLIDEMIN